MIFFASASPDGEGSPFPLLVKLSTGRRALKPGRGPGRAHRSPSDGDILYSLRRLTMTEAGFIMYAALRALVAMFGIVAVIYMILSQNR